MSEGIDLFNFYAQNHVPRFFTVTGRILFCDDQYCISCVIKHGDSSKCFITEQEYDNIKASNPEYMI
jgi:hypothetical protein